MSAARQGMSHEHMHELIACAATEHTAWMRQRRLVGAFAEMAGERGPVSISKDL